MKLLSINLARSIWLINLIDINPYGLHGATIFEDIIRRYEFIKFPRLSEIDLQKGAMFEGGRFENKKGNVIIISMQIFNDGFVVDSRSSTDDSEDFLKEMLSYLTDKYGLANYKSALRKINYVSQLYITTDKSLEIINPKFKTISEYLNKNTVGFDTISFELGGIQFWNDQVNKDNPSPFTLERTLNTPFSEKRYFSTSCLRTEQHLELLEILDKLIEG